MAVHAADVVHAAVDGQLEIAVARGLGRGGRGQQARHDQQPLPFSRRGQPRKQVRTRGLDELAKPGWRILRPFIAKHQMPAHGLVSRIEQES